MKSYISIWNQIRGRRRFRDETNKPVRLIGYEPSLFHNLKMPRQSFSLLSEFKQSQILNGPWLRILMV